jgi:pyruvate dehydrogenase E1 component beta subunit
MLAAQHSQSTEALWSHIPGLKVVMPANPKDAKGLLKSAIRDDNPIVFIEGEVLYADQGEIPDGEYTIPLGVAEVKRPGKDLTIIGWSKMVKIALGAAEALAAEGIEAEVVDPRTIRPLDEELLVQSVSKTGRCLIIEEGWPFNGVGAEIAYRIGRRCFDDLDAPVERITGADMPMPYNHHLEQQCIPDVPRAVAAAKKLLYLE